MKYLNDYIQTALANGQYFFSKEEVLVALKISAEQFRQQAYRLGVKKALYSLTPGFFMIIPTEYRHLGSLPPHWIIDPLMEHLGQPYYIGLLSAASLSGATHQQPMVFQVVTTKKRRSIRLARGMIEFHQFQACKKAFKERITLPTGYAYVSSKEQTMLDVLRFYPACGHMNNAAQIIKDLAPECTETALQYVVQNESNNAVLQRLGYLLTSFGYTLLASYVYTELAARTIQFVPLSPSIKTRAGQRIIEFKVIINEQLEFDQ
jgi:predicted transcriptional regulator of viral defense system